MIAIGVLLSLAAASSTKEVTPEELGAVTSAIAFVDVCKSLRDAPQHLKGSKPEERAMVDISLELCRGMVRAVATTVAADPDYKVNGSRVCVGEDLTADKVIDEMGAMIEKDRAPFAGTPTPMVETPAAILGAIHRLSPCTPAS